MSIKSVRMYEVDGRKFDSYEDAKQHLRLKAILDEIRKGMALIEPGHSVGTLPITLANDPEKLRMIRDICNKGLDFHRNYGKLKKS